MTLPWKESTSRCNQNVTSKNCCHKKCSFHLVKSTFHNNFCWTKTWMICLVVMWTSKTWLCICSMRKSAINISAIVTRPNHVSPCMRWSILCFATLGLSQTNLRFALSIWQTKLLLEFLCSSKIYRSRALWGTDNGLTKSRFAFLPKTSHWIFWSLATESW